MTSVENEIKTYFGICKFCSRYGYLKCMRTKYYYNGSVEIYADMLEKCYNIKLDNYQPSTDKICYTCVKKLRNALEFRRLLEMSLDHAVFNADFGDERMDFNVVNNLDYERMDNNIVDNPGDMFKYDIVKDEPSENDAMSLDDNEEEVYEDVEYLEDISDDNEDINNGVIAKTIDNQTKTKWPKKLPRHLRNKTYKQYTEEDLKRCVDAVKVDGMTQREAAGIFNVPRSILAVKLSANNVEDQNKDRTYFFHKEIKAILSYTDATPYRYRNNKYYCMYCNTSDTMFQDPNCLRSHMRDRHVKDRVEKVEIIMRPHGLNEILKVDIEDLVCVECCQAIPDWNNMLHHIESVHNVELEHAYTRIIPYVLKEEYRCCLCDELSSNYLQLDAHMNSHYNNYVCSECGDHYLSFLRLKAHEKIHAVGKYCCDVCGKNFTLKKYLKKHIDGVHKQVLNFRCLYCEEKFPSEVCRQSHVQNKHSDKITPINCELCGRVFLWRQYYKAHMRNRHRGKLYKCNQCDKKFSRRYELKEHLNVHSNIIYQCVQCEKPYTSKASLRMHIRLKHVKDGDTQSSDSAEKLSAPECDYCFKKFDNYATLTEHKKLHNKKYECLSCHRFYSSKPSLRMHTRLKHVNEINVKYSDE